MTKHKLSDADLAQFISTDVKYRHQFTPLLYTDGVQYMAEKGGAYWLIDEIAFSQRHKRIRTTKMLREFQIWELKVKEKDGRRSATLTMRADSDQGTIIRKRIPYTDFPLEYIKLYVEGGTLMLASER